MRSRLSSSRSAVLVLTALAGVLAVAAVLLWLSDRRADEVKVQGEPMSDAQAAGQALASAKQIVRVAQLHDVTGGYAFMSCKNGNEPPYQGRDIPEFPFTAKQFGEVSSRCRRFPCRERLGSRSVDG